MEDLVKHYNTLKREGFTEEYVTAKSICESDPTYVTRLTRTTSDVASRNRYGNIITLEDTRVRLTTVKEGESDYINSSHVNFQGSSPSIVAQAPLKNTNEHFWRMCWEQDTPLIVMLTNFEEPASGFGGGKREKCARYFPEIEKEQMCFGDFEIVCLNQPIRHFEGWYERTLRVTNKEVKQTRDIVHIHCVDWPDFGRLVTGQLQGLSYGIESVQTSRESSKGPPVVHCSAGVGRSGTFVALEMLMNLAKEGKWSEVDPLKVVAHLRNQRPGMVQTSSQYEMIYDVLVSLLTKPE